MAMNLRFRLPRGATSKRSRYPGTVALVLSLTLIGVAGCGGSGGGATKGASARPTPTRTQVPTGAIQAAKTLLDPALHAGGTSSNPCAQSEPPYLSLDCPITPRLRRAIFRNYVYQRQYRGSVDPVCRCQGPPLSTRYHVPVATSRFAQVVAIRKYYGGYSHLTFIVLHTPAGWKTDDIYCTGEIRGSIDNSAILSPCSLQRS